MASFTAFRTSEVFKKVTFGDTIANVDFRVSPAGGNDRGDVQLVQFLLSSAIAVSENIGVPLRDERGNVLKDPLNLTGIYDFRTQTMLRAFQRQIATLTRNKALISARAPIKTDGIVDKSNPTGVSTISKTIYTIVYLNVAFISAAGRTMTLDDVSIIEPLHTQLSTIDLGDV